MQLMTTINKLWKRLQHFFGRPDNRISIQLGGVFIANSNDILRQLSDVEISFLTMLEGKRADDPSVLGWWCAFYKVDRSKLIGKLSRNGYITLADCKVNVKMATIPILKDFLSKQGLSIKGKKADLVSRIIENVSETECLIYFKQSYWALTVKAVALLDAEKMKAEVEYKKTIELIRKGSYNEFKKIMYPNKNEHWGTEDTFYDTIAFIMDHGFEEFGLSEDVRLNISSFIAARSVNYSSRGYSACKENISACLSSFNIDLDSFEFPYTLLQYAQDNEIGEFDELLNIYIQFTIGRARAIAQLNNYKRMGVKKVKIDTVGCCQCGKSLRDKAHNINKVPLLPMSWNCQCSYSPVLRSK